MTTQEQAYINGFVKRANEHGYSEEQALWILKGAADAQVVPPQVVNDLGRGLSTLDPEGDTGVTWTGGSETMPEHVRVALGLPKPLSAGTASAGTLSTGTQAATQQPKVMPSKPQPSRIPPVKVDPAHMNDTVVQPGAKSVIPYKQ